MCSHQPTCPPVTDGHTDPLTACIVADHPEQGWSLLCNGVVRFYDGGALLPDGTSVPPARLTTSTTTTTSPVAVPVAA